MQPELSFKEKRETYKHRLWSLELTITIVFTGNPELINIKKGNELIRYLWKHYGDYSANSILRIARKIRAKGLDTKENQNERANSEVAYREHFKI